MQNTKTVFALSTPLGGAIAVIRISGSKTKQILSEIFTGKIKHSMLAYGKLKNGEKTIDEIMAVYFQSPKSYTGEDMAELHIHASRAVAESVMSLLIDKGAYPAEAGEFSKRAFLNGKMNLSQAEAVMDLINSSAKRSASSAVLQLSGVLSKRIHLLEDKLTDALALLDAIIDYPDEMEDADSDITDIINSALCEIDKLCNEGLRSHHIRDGYTIAIAGKPNVGKSSLLNCLISQDKAIVTDIAGTTRDIIEADAVFEDLPVHIFDTAGIRQTSDTIEQIGIERTKEAISCADLLYIALDTSEKLSQYDYDLLEETKDKDRIIVLCKSDKPLTADLPSFDGETVIAVSSKDGTGITQLKKHTASLICPDDESGVITNMRHIKALEYAKRSLNDALAATESDCIATDVRQALNHVSEITGDYVDEDVLTRIFERFCVGK